MIEIVDFYKGSEKNYSYLKNPTSEEHKNGLFFATDTKRLYLNGEVFGRGLNNIIDIEIESSILKITFEDQTTHEIDLRNVINLASNEENGLMSKEDKIYIDELPTILNDEFEKLSKYISEIQSDNKRSIAELADEIVEKTDTLNQQLEDSVSSINNTIDNLESEFNKLVGIESIIGPEESGIQGNVDDYTINLSNGESFEFSVSNGDSPIILILTDDSTIVPVDYTGKATVDISNSAFLRQDDKDLGASFEWKTSSIGNNLDTSFPTNDGNLTISADTISNWKSDLIQVICYATYNDKIYTKTWTITKVKEPNFELEYSDNKIRLYNHNLETVSEIDASDFIKDGMLDRVEVVEITAENPIDDYEEGTYLKFVWNSDGENKITYIEANKIGKIYSGSDSIEISNTNEITLKKADADVVSIKEIPVAGGPLSNLLINAGITTISEGTDLQDLLMQLFCKEIWPNVSHTTGTFKMPTSFSSPSISANKSICKPGDTITFTVNTSKIPSYTSTPNKVSGMTNGYSIANDDSQYSSETSISKNWNVSKLDEEYTLVISGGENNASYSSDTSMSKTYSIIAKLGTGNTCVASCSGSVTYSATIDEIPSYYYLSNIGKTSSDRKTNVIASNSVEETFDKTSTSSSSVSCVYPVYHNVLNSTFNDDTLVEMGLSTSKTYTVSNIPSEETTDKTFIFEYPSNNQIKSVNTTPIPSAYKVYTNAGPVLTETAMKEHNWSTSMRFDAPTELELNLHFMIEYPACANIVSLSKLNPISGEFDSIKYVSESINRDGHSYIRIYPDSIFVGETKYELNFSNPTSSVESNYTIESGFTKIINGVEYDYSRLITSGSNYSVNRTITLAKEMWT